MPRILDFYEQTPPSAQIAANRFDATCLDNQIQFVDHSAVSGQGTTWYWEFENGTPSTSTLRNPVVSYDMIGSHDVSLTVTDAFGTNTLQNDTKQKLLPFKAQGITHIYLLFDGDEAGDKAAKALKPLIEAENFIVEIIKLPDDKDPGELDMLEVKSIAEYITK